MPLNFSYYERKQQFLKTQQKQGAVVISKPLDPVQIAANYEQYKIQREVNRQMNEETDRWQKEQKQQLTQENQARYSLKPVKVSAHRECCICGAQIPKGTRVLHRTGTEANPNTRNGALRWVNYYYCQNCRGTQP